MVASPLNVGPIVARYLRVLQEQVGLRIERAYIYGSHVRGNATDESDIDVAIISGDFGTDWLANALLLRRARWEVDLRLEPMAFRPEQFCQDNPLAWEIMSSGTEVLVTGATNVGDQARG